MCEILIIYDTFFVYYKWVIWKCRSILKQSNLLYSFLYLLNRSDEIAFFDIKLAVHKIISADWLGI